MKTGLPKVWLLAIVISLGFAGIWQLQHKIDAQQAALSQEQDVVVLQSPKLAKWMSLEYAPLMADVYWTRVVQYYGNKHIRKQANLDSLWPLLNITATLDPNLLVAYRFGGMFLSQRQPTGAGRPDLAVELLQRGIKANPDYWRLYQDLGFVYYFDLKDYKRASEAFLEGSKNPDAQVWMKVMAAKIAAEGESFSTSVFLWKDLYENTRDPLLKSNALTHLQLLQVQSDCAQLNQIADAYEKKFAKRPARVSQLIQAGMLRGIPQDPAGYAYVFTGDGKADLNLDSPLLEKRVIMERVQQAVPKD
jgi:tetratricopeptide (TPR) repeat protein